MQNNILEAIYEEQVILFEDQVEFFGDIQYQLVKINSCYIVAFTYDYVPGQKQAELRFILDLDFDYLEKNQFKLLKGDRKISVKTTLPIEISKSEKKYPQQCFAKINIMHTEFDYVILSGAMSCSLTVKADLEILITSVYYASLISCRRTENIAEPTKNARLSNQNVVDETVDGPKIDAKSVEWGTLLNSVNPKDVLIILDHFIRLINHDEDVNLVKEQQPSVPVPQLNIENHSESSYITEDKKDKELNHLLEQKKEEVFRLERELTSRNQTIDKLLEIVGKYAIDGLKH